jgi:hypothetical protein
MSRSPQVIGSLFVFLLCSSQAAQADPLRFRAAADWHKGRPVPTAAGPFGEVATPVGAVPPGASQSYFSWDRKADEVYLAVYINAGDPYGVCISNLKSGDVVRITSAHGVCRFSKGDAVKDVLSFVGVAGTAVAAKLVPPAAPFVEPATGFASKKLVPSSRGQQRDAYGYDPGTGDYCQDEGGVIVCLPGAGGAYYRGGKNGTIPRKAPRTDGNVPGHVKGAFFPVRDNDQHNTRTVDKDGEMFLLAWDAADAFDDNTGYYLVHLRIKQAGK